MTKESLRAIPLEELVALARSEGFEETGAPDRATLTEFILENRKERAREREEENNASIQVEEAKFQIVETQSAASEGPDSFAIAERYNQTKIVFMVRDPHWAFAYWDLEKGHLEKLRTAEEIHQLVLRVHDLGSAIGSYFDIPIQLGDWSWYIYLPNQNREYLLELGIITSGKYRCLARSNAIRTPRESYAQSGDGTDGILDDFELQSSESSSGAIPQRILTGGLE